MWIGKVGGGSQRFVGCFPRLNFFQLLVGWGKTRVGIGEKEHLGMRISF